MVSGEVLGMQPFKRPEGDAAAVARTLENLRFQKKLGGGIDFRFLNLIPFLRKRESELKELRANFLLLAC